MSRFFVIIAACLLAACGSGQGAEPDTAPDAEPADSASDDGSTTETTEPADTSEPADTGADATSPGDVPFSLTCNDDDACRTPCAVGVCRTGTCDFGAAAPTATGCIVPSAPGAPTFVCAAPGSAGPDGCGVCAPRVIIEGETNLVFAEDFDGVGGQFLIERRAFSTATWLVDDHRSHDGTRSLYFGDTNRRSYDVGDRAAADAVTRPIPLPADGVPLVLAFALFADTEETPDFDYLQVLVRDASGNDRLLWSSDELAGTTLGAFAAVRVAIDAFPPEGRIVFRADSVDGIINDFEGFYVDAIRLVRACCSNDSDCDDGIACTTDACDAGRCQFQTAPDCCSGVRDCDDRDVCTRDGCDLATGTCAHDPIATCCRTDAACDDGDACTRDSCEADGTCRNIPVCCSNDAGCDDGDICTTGSCVDGFCRYANSCCTEQSECDDGDPCTDDACGAGLCRNTFNNAPGCCLPDVLSQRFDTDTAATWTLSPATNNIGWRLLASATAPSAPRILYYGHPTLLFYESGGRNQGSATSPAFRLPQGVGARVSFRVRLDIENSPERDLFSVEAIVGSETVVLAAKTSLAFGAWQDVEYDLSFAAGQLVRLRFRFDTVDGVANTGRGVSIDDVQVYSDCRARPCNDASECPDRLSCVTPTCDDGICQWRGDCGE